MTTHIYHHDACLGHDPGPDRAYAPARLRSVIQSLQGDDFKQLEWRHAEEIARDALTLIHTPTHIDAVLKPVPESEQRLLGPDTIAVTGTAKAALAASGVVAQAVKSVLDGQARNAFCIVSPGGHHAEAEMALGFCFFNHTALGAVMAQRLYGLQRVAVIDIDAHHGNGTQSMFWNHADRLFVSVHEESAQSGFAEERGSAENIVNIPLPHGSGGLVFRRAVTKNILPVVKAFRPELILISAGFDMHKDDPLGNMCLEVGDYGWAGKYLSELADEVCQGRLVALLEGGYNLDVLGASVAAFVKGMIK